jgi:putative hydrolase of the HAD superfamily
MSIQAVIFDRDNTLIRFDPAAIARLEARIAVAAPGLPPGAAPAHWQAWPGPWPATLEEEPAFWCAFWSSLAAQHGLPPAAAERLLEIGGFYHTCFTALPGAAACLRALRRRGLRLAVLTNFELPSVDRTLAHAGLDPALFDVLLSSTAVGARKPAPAAYLAAADALGVPPAVCAFIDDRPENVRGACAVGMRGILVGADSSLDGLEVAIDLTQIVPLFSPQR